MPGAIPVPGDYDGDGRAEAAVFRSSNNTWYVATTSAGTFASPFGIQGDVPVAKDYDGDGKTDLAVYRPANGVWFIAGSLVGAWNYQWGLPGDILVPGDYDGDGRSDAAVFRPGNSTWYIAGSSAGFQQSRLELPAMFPWDLPILGYLASAAPVLRLENLTHPNLGTAFLVGDTYRITIVGPPNQPVTMVQTANGAVSNQSFGNTDVYGRLVVDYVEQTANIGTYTQVWSVGGVQASSAVSFMVGQFGGGTVSVSDLGTTADGHILGVSILSIANGSATTYSATELDDAASLYYDAGTSATLYEEGTAVRSGSASGSGRADGYMSAPSTAWKDYDIQTDHYVVAYIPYGPYFVNQFYYQDGSCDGYSSDCTFGPGGGFYYVTVASIYLGSTLAHQTNVPQDGTVPLVDDSAYNNFLSIVSPPPDSGVIFTVDAWGKIIRDVAPILFIARSVWADQHPENPYIYPLPYLVDLIGDTQSTPKNPGDKAERLRTYLLEDTYGRPWSDNNPVKVSEIFHFAGGDRRYMPPPNNPSTPNSVPWSPFSNPKEMHSGLFDDSYRIDLNASPYAAVWYLQFYWASGFTVPPEFTLFPIPGITDGSMPGVTGPVIPLMIKSKDPRNSPQCADFASQGVLLRSDYIGINGDTGPANPPGCPRELGIY